MDYFFLKMKGILMNKSLKIHIDNRKKNSTKICLGETLFPPLVKKTMETKKMRHKTLIYLDFFKIIFGGKNDKNVNKR